MRVRAGFLTFVFMLASIAAIPGARAASTSASTQYRKVIAAAIADLHSYWTDVYPEYYGTKYQPLAKNRIIAARPGTQIPRCQGQKVAYRDVEGNAFYCIRSNFIAYDDVKLMPGLVETFGTFSVALVLAHEWGHAIQDRAGNSGQRSVLVELQADCFAGAFLSHVSDGRTRLAFEPGDLEASLGAMLQLRDAPGESPDDPSAHGSAFDRISAFQDGFQTGPGRCAAYFDEPPVLVQIPFSTEEDASSGGELAAEDVIPTAVDLLNDFYSQVEPNFVPLSIDNIVSFDSSKRATIPRCGPTTLSRSTVRNRVFYCLDDGYVAFDEPFLQAVYDEIGDFGVASLLANPWATYVQTIQGIPGVADNGLDVVFQADCYTGGWSAALFNGVLTGGSLSPGDLDEFVQAFLAYSRARGVEADVPITFLRIAFFRVGFLEGYQACDYDEIAAAVADLE